MAADSLTLPANPQLALLAERIRLVMRADRAMLTLNGAGREQLEVASPPTAHGPAVEELSQDIVIDGRPAGRVSVTRCSPGLPFTDADRHALGALTEMTAATLALELVATARARQIEIASRSARAVGAATTVEEALIAASDALFAGVGYLGVAATLVDHDAGEQVLVADLVTTGVPAPRMRRPLDEGIVGHAIRSGRQVSVGRVSEDPRFSWRWPLELESLLVTPIIVDGRVVAAIEASDPRPDLFDPFDETLMRTVAENLAAVWQTIMLRDESERRAQRLTLAAEIAHLVTVSGSVEEMLDAVARAVFDEARYDCVTAFEVRHDTGEQVAVSAHSRQGFRNTGLRRPIGDGITGRVIRTGAQFLTGNALADPDYSWPEETCYESMIITPVVADGHCIAIVTVGHERPHQFDSWDAVLMETVADQVATAMQGARLREESERRAARLAVSLAVATAVADAQTTNSVLATAVDTLFDSTGYDCVAAVAAHHDTAEQEIVAVRARGGERPVGRRRPIQVGMTGRVIASHHQARGGRIELDPDTTRWEDEAEYRSGLITPVVVDGACVATLELYDEPPDRFELDDATLMQTVAEQVAAALRGARLRVESEQRARRLALVAEVARAAATAESEEEALRVVADRTFALADYQAVGASLALPKAGEQVVIALQFRGGERIDGVRRPIGSGLTGAVLERREPLYLSRASDHPGPAWPGAPQRIESVLLAPVIVGGSCVAVIGICDERQDAFDSSDEQLVATLAENTAAIVRGARLRAESQQRAERLAALERRHRGLLERLVRAQEQERSQVAGDLHDDTIQVMSACVIALDRVRRLIESGDTVQAAANLADVATLVSDAVDRTRRMTFQLRPAVLWHHGLGPAVNQLLASLREEAGVSVQLVADELPARLEPTVETIAFRSVSELLTNVRNHAQASRVTVTLGGSADTLTAEVRDDGRGFDLPSALARARATNHLGLESLTERIDAAGGQVQISTAPGLGTVARLTLPIRT